MTAVAEKLARVPQWRHRIVLPDGSVTPGFQDTARQWSMLKMPKEMWGKSVLDIGCSDGYFSFECERRGAKRVLAVDNFSSMYVDSPAGFHVAHELLDSRVEFRQGDLFDLDPAEIGQFDIVLFLGVLYHLRHPLRAIDHLATLCKDLIVLETELSSPPGLWGKLKRRLVGADDAFAFMRFHEGDDLNHDPTNWWAPTPRCVEGMLRSAGWCAVQTVSRERCRGVFQGHAPRKGMEPVRLLQGFGPRVVLEALGRDGGGNPSRQQALDVLRELSVVEFARLRQALLERRALEWHHRQAAEEG